MKEKIRYEMSRLKAKGTGERRERNEKWKELKKKGQGNKMLGLAFHFIV